MTWLRPVDRTSGTLTLSAGTLSCLAHHGTPLSKRCPTTTALERTGALFEFLGRKIRVDHRLDAPARRADLAQARPHMIAHAPRQ